MRMMPIPMAMENMMTPPNNESLLAMAALKAEINSGDTQAPTIKAEINPNTNTPKNEPPFIFWLWVCRRDWKALGIWISNKPN